MTEKQARHPMWDALRTVAAELDRLQARVQALEAEQGVAEESAKASAECGLEWAKRAEAAEAQVQALERRLAELKGILAGSVGQQRR